MTFRAWSQIWFIIWLNLTCSMVVGFVVVTSSAPIWARIVCLLIYVAGASALGLGVRVVRE